MSNPSTSQPVACTLTTKKAAQQLLEWHELKGVARSIEDLGTTVHMTLPGALLDAVEDLAERERQCCAFLTIDVAAADDGEVVHVHIGSENPDARPILAMFAARAG